MPRHDMKKLTTVQLENNLKVLASFSSRKIRYKIFSNDNLTIRSGIFTKTSGKFNPLKMIVRRADDSLTNIDRLDEIADCFYEYFEQVIKPCHIDIFSFRTPLILNAFQGFCNLAWKYKDRGDGWKLIKKLIDIYFLDYKTDAVRNFNQLSASVRIAEFSQLSYTEQNKVNLDGTCWALVADWCRRIILKNKFTYTHGKQVSTDPNTNEQVPTIININRRGKLMPKVFQLDPHVTHADMGVALGNLPVNAANDDLVQDYYRNRQKNGNTLQEKFQDIKYTPHYYCRFFLNPISVGFEFFIDNCSVIKNIISFLMAKQKDRGDGVNVAWVFSFQMENMFDPNKTSGHACGFFYDRKGARFYFMDPNYGDFRFYFQDQVERFIYSLLRLYALNSRLITSISIAKFENINNAVDDTPRRFPGIFGI